VRSRNPGPRVAAAEKVIRRLSHFSAAVAGLKQAPPEFSGLVGAALTEDNTGLTPAYGNSATPSACCDSTEAWATQLESTHPLKNVVPRGCAVAAS
jgi:hypothetical protein